MKTCLILGNGPSLNRLPPEVFASMPSFGMNFAKMQPTYYVCVDSRVLTEHAKEIYPLAAGAEIAYLSGKHLNGDAHLPTAKLYALPNVEIVWKDQGAFRMERYMSGMTASYVCLKLAYVMGFQEVHLWGVDHSPDWQHYREDYPQDMAATRTDRMKAMEYHYQLAMMVYARAGRRILNHSDPSPLDKIFRRG
jgi:hypothetical protein